MQDNHDAPAERDIAQSLGDYQELQQIRVIGDRELTAPALDSEASKTPALSASLRREWLDKLHILPKGAIAHCIVDDKLQEAIRFVNSDWRDPSKRGATALHLAVLFGDVNLATTLLYGAEERAVFKLNKKYNRSSLELGPFPHCSRHKSARAHTKAYSQRLPIAI